MKMLPWLLSMTCLSATAALAQNYQYQYPSDPYSPTPTPQPAYSSSSSSTGSYEKLLSWGSLQARYNYYDYKLSGLENSSGFAADLHVPLFKPLFLSAGISWFSGTDNRNRSFDLTSITGGGGVFLPLGSRVHIFGEVGARFDIASGDKITFASDEISVYLRPGVRFAVTEKLELAASVMFATTDNFDDRAVEFNGYYALLSVLDVGAGVDFAEDVNTYHAGLRLRW